MNFLAHLYLAGEDNELIIGNFIADTVKGNHYTMFPERVAKGILMHRSIDYFSDTHPIYLQSVHRLAPTYHKFSGVITDMFYDHFLASMWGNYSDIPLEQFAKKSYDILKEHESTMPEKCRMILYYMSKHDWLSSYARKEGLRRALKGLSERMKYYSPMDKAVDDLDKNFDLYKNDFLGFFPLLQKHAEGLRN